MIIAVDAFPYPLSELNSIIGCIHRKIIAAEVLVYQWFQASTGGLGIYLLWMEEHFFRYMHCLSNKSSPALPLLSLASSIGGGICEEEEQRKNKA